MAPFYSQTTQSYLEAGGYYTAADFTEEKGPMTARLYAESGARATDDPSVAIFQGRSVGGGTTVNWRIMLRTPPNCLRSGRPSTASTA